MERCNWTIDMYRNRMSGKTKLSMLERETLEKLAKELSMEQESNVPQTPTSTPEPVHQSENLPQEV